LSVAYGANDVGEAAVLLCVGKPSQSFRGSALRTFNGGNVRLMQNQ